MDARTNSNCLQPPIQRKSAMDVDAITMHNQCRTKEIERGKEINLVQFENLMLQPALGVSYFWSGFKERLHFHG